MMRRLPTKLLDEERDRAKRVRRDRPRTVSSGELWTIRTSIMQQSAPHILIEHSRVPMIVAILSVDRELVDAAPVSFDVDLAADGDVVVADSSLLGRSFMIECWLHMPITSMAVDSRVGKLADPLAKAVLREAKSVTRRDLIELPIEDPRRAYRLDERMRVVFAIAGTGAEIEFRDARNDLDDPALRLKRGEPPRWTAQRAAPAIRAMYGDDVVYDSTPADELAAVNSPGGKST